MIAFPSMLEGAAKEAGIKVPEDPDDFDPMSYPHFQLFCCAQLGRPMSPGAHWENAKVIAAIPEAEVTTVTAEDLEKKGWII